MHETQVQSLVREDPTCCCTTKPMSHNYWVCAPEPGNHNRGGLCSLEPMICNKRSHCNEKPAHRNWRVPPLTAYAAVKKSRCRKAQHSHNIKQILNKFFKLKKKDSAGRHLTLILPLRQRGASVQSLPLSQLPLTCPATSYPGRNPLCPFSDKHPVCLSLHKPRDRGLTCSQAAWPIVRDL